MPYGFIPLLLNTCVYISFTIQLLLNQRPPHAENHLIAACAPTTAAWASTTPCSTARGLRIFQILFPRQTRRDGAENWESPRELAARPYNIVISRQARLSAEGAETVGSLEEAFGIMCRCGRSHHHGRRTNLCLALPLWPAICGLPKWH